MFKENLKAVFTGDSFLSLKLKYIERIFNIVCFDHFAHFMSFWVLWVEMENKDLLIYLQLSDYFMIDEE